MIINKENLKEIMVIAIENNLNFENSVFTKNEQAIILDIAHKVEETFKDNNWVEFELNMGTPIIEIVSEALTQVCNAVAEEVL